MPHDENSTPPPGEKLPVPTIAIIGPGAIGCTVGAALLEAGQGRVLFCGTRTFSRVRIDFPDSPAIDLPAEVRTSPEDLPHADWVLLCVKVHQTPTTAPGFRALLGPDTRVAVLQNGVEHHDTVRPFLDDATRVLPVVVQIPAQLTAPGQVSLPAPPHLVVPAGVLGDAFAELFTGSRIPVKPTSNFLESLWRKLCLNAANGSITALCAQTEIVLRQPPIAQLVRDIVRETMAIAEAEGAILPDTLPDDILAALLSAPDLANRGNSMYFDRMAGRQLEADARNGVVVRLGARHGVPTPVNSTLYALLQTFGRQP